MRGAARACNDDLVARGACAPRECIQALGGAMSRHDALFACNAECGERFGGEAHGVPVRLATHDDGDRGGHSNRFFSQIQKHKADYRFSPGVARQPEWSMVSWSMAVPMKKKPKLSALKTVRRRTGNARAGTKPDQAGRVKRAKARPKSQPRAGPADPKLAIRRLRSELQGRGCASSNWKPPRIRIFCSTFPIVA